MVPQLPRSLCADLRSGLAGIEPRSQPIPNQREFADTERRSIADRLLLDQSRDDLLAISRLGSCLGRLCEAPVPRSSSNRCSCMAYSVAHVRRGDGSLAGAFRRPGGPERDQAAAFTPILAARSLVQGRLRPQTLPHRLQIRRLTFALECGFVRPQFFQGVRAPAVVVGPPDRCLHGPIMRVSMHCRSEQSLCRASSGAAGE